MSETKCKECDFSHPAHQGKLWCDLAHTFVEKLGNFCPKELSIGMIKKSCKFYDNENDNCLVHVAEGWGVHSCWIKELKDLLRDPDFTLKEGKE